MLASRSPAYPLALWAAPSIAIGLIGSNPFPNNSVELFLVGWALLAILLVLLRDREALPFRFLFAPPVLLSIGLAILMVARLGGSEAQAYGSFKLQRFLAENLLFLVAGMLIARRRSDFDLWAGVLLATTALGALVVTQGLATDPGKFESVGGRFALYAEATPIGLGRDTAAAMLIAVYFVLAAASSRRRLAALAAIPILMIAFVASGSRGPLAGLLVGVVIMLALTLGDPASRRRLLLVAVAAVAAALLVPQLVPGENTSRVLSILVGNNEGQSFTNGRYDAWAAAWNAFAAHPLLGIGTGGYASIDPVELFPHNILLEAAAELGVLGLLFVLAVVVSTAIVVVRVWRGADARERQRAALVAALAGAALVNSFVSGDIASNSALWLASGLTLGLAGRFAPGAPLEPLRWAGTHLRREWRAVPSERRRLEPLIRQPSGEMLPRMADQHATRPTPTELGIALADVPALLRGATALHARVQDESALRWVEFQVTPAGTHEWQVLSRVDRPPFVLTFDTSRLADGLYDFRALGADRRGRVEYSRPVRGRRVANVARAIAIREPRPGAWLRGVVSLSARVTDGAGVQFELSRDGTHWQALPGASWDTNVVRDGEYRLRATGADGWGASGQIRVLVDNTPPRVGLVEPPDGAAVSGTVRVAAEAEDSGSGILAVRFHGSDDGFSWQELASVTRPPYVIGLDTSTLADREYAIRAVARDRAGNDAATRTVWLRVESSRAGESGVVADATAEPAPPAEPEALSLDRITLWQLERLVAERGPRSDEQEALLYSLRPYVNVDGTIPQQFWGLIRETFEGLVD